MTVLPCDFRFSCTNFSGATRLEEYSYFGLVEMVIFIFILALGLAYAWRKGVLRWA